MIDVQLLRILKHKSEYLRLRNAIPAKVLDPQTQAILADIGKYYEKFPDHTAIDFSVFEPAFRRWHPTLDDEQYNAYLPILRSMRLEADEGTKKGILHDLYEQVLASNIVATLASFEGGECPDIFGQLNIHLDQFRRDAGIKVQSYVEDDIWDIMQDDVKDIGLTWRLSCLNEHMRPLRGGDFGVVAGRPDGGKTTFLASEITYMASQLADDQNVLWLNNEGKGQRIKYRIWQAALGLTQPQMMTAGRDNLISWYMQKVGRLDRIRVYDIHGYNTGQVEALMEAANPGLVVWDMIDHIKGFADTGRDDLRLEEMYKWARERCVKFNCVGIATSQISNEGDGLMFPSLGMLKDSKTGKQGASDFQLMIGRSNDQNLQFSRFISLPKNKLRRTGTSGDPRAEVRYVPDNARYEDIIVGA